MAARKKTATRKQATRKKATGKRAVPARKGRFRRTPRKAIATILELLAEHDPHPRCALDHANAYELLAATILSAQCTDVRVNMVTPALFARYPQPDDLATADQEDVEELVRSTGFFRNKAKNLRGMAAGLVRDHDGAVPQSMDELLQLPGVARKTANVVLGECFGLAEGVVVDTHVGRISRRLGLTDETDPVKVERDLMKLVPREQWIRFSHRLIRLGRGLCDARKPDCEACYLRPHCPRIGVDR